MDEGDGEKTVDAMGRFDGQLIGGTSWQDGYCLLYTSDAADE